ncbi:PREDICTED: dynamin-like 120 kDa protein, mitochondrial [Papilio polytes]|uniref:dynamin-like 120 kDa protein, mitochondrial n=1 Tax=Papilio polytes TaxID=76194 RepID=UPI0006768512|nr:PREDICTED: dynamin-like 120 kDa protein, mitochondrial [Papilio polytes]
MSRILHNRLRSSLKKPTAWSCFDKRAVAFSIWTGKSMLLYKPIDPINIPRRKYGMLIARAVRGVLKIRYLVLGGAVGGGMTLNKKYSEWKDGLPDMGWLNDLLPDNEQWNRFTTTLLDAKDRISDQLQIGRELTLSLAADPRLRDAGVERAAELRAWLAQRYEDAVAAAAANTEPAPQQIQNNLQSRPAPSSAGGRGSAEEAAAYEKRVHALQEEVLALQARYQRELQRLEQENRELRQQNMLLRQGRQPPARKLKRSLIDMYSAVLDELSGWESGEAGRLPRVVVVGDQSAGKTSVLEMIAQARIFPRGAGEMCTRAPVKVTLSEGPYHVAQFRDSSREFDLNKESDLADLRKEVELRMRNSVRGGRTVSTDVIAMSVRGPGLPRMVLVDLPGVISTQTVDMASDTRDAIKQMTRTYMDNPNAIILCIQDGSVDAERSNVTDLVSSCDPQGKRTIFVLTKVDLAEENLANPNRIRRILEGKLFPMRALGYYAVVTGRSRKDDSIQSIRDYEERFFRSSKLFKDGLVTPSQVTTRNLSLAVAECFWRMVRATVEQQADAFKAMRFNLETEWKNTFPRLFLQVLRVLQLNALQDRCVASRADWDAAVALMETALKEKLSAVDEELKSLTGPGLRERWLYWQSSSEEQQRRGAVRAELERLGSSRPSLAHDEVVAVRDNLRRQGVDVDNDYIRETWKPVYLKHFLERAQTRARDCKKSFYLYSQQNGTGQKECCEVVMFWRVWATLRTTANALRQQIGNREAARLDRDLREVLDEMSADPELKQKLLSGRRVELAEELKRVRQVQEKLEEFIEALNKEK